MKVLHVSTHMNIGGIGNYVLSLSSALKNKGVSVITASSGGSLEGEFLKLGIPHKKIGIDTKFEFGPKVLFSVPALCRIIREEKVDIVHAHSRVSQVASRLASSLTKVPYLTTCHGFFKKRARGIFDTWGVKVVAISDYVKRHLMDDLGVAEDRIKLIYSGVDAGRFARKFSDEEKRELKRSLGLSDDGPVIGTIGRLSPVKGQKFIIEAMRDVVKEFRGAQILIIGSGPEEAALKELACSAGLQDAVRFVSSCPDTHKFLSIMDIFVFPSIKEGLGIALLEALASERACVASDVGGIGDIIKDKANGILVPVGDIDAIAGAVISLLRDPDTRREMGRRGRKLIEEKFLLTSMADKMIELYGTVLNGSNR